MNFQNKTLLKMSKLLLKIWNSRSNRYCWFRKKGHKNSIYVNPPSNDLLKNMFSSCWSIWEIFLTPNETNSKKRWNLTEIILLLPVSGRCQLDEFLSRSGRCRILVDPTRPLSQRRRPRSCRQIGWSLSRFCFNPEK